jgi:hypothetical protein
MMYTSTRVLAAAGRKLAEAFAPGARRDENDPRRRHLKK